MNSVVSSLQQFLADAQISGRVRSIKSTLYVNIFVVASWSCPGSKRDGGMGEEETAQWTKTETDVEKLLSYLWSSVRQRQAEGLCSLSVLSLLPFFLPPSLSLHHPPMYPLCNISVFHSASTLFPADSHWNRASPLWIHPIDANNVRSSNPTCVALACFVLSASGRTLHCLATRWLLLLALLQTCNNSKASYTL